MTCTASWIFAAAKYWNSTLTVSPPNEIDSLQLPCDRSKTKRWELPITGNTTLNGTSRPVDTWTNVGLDSVDGMINSAESPVPDFTLSGIPLPRSLRRSSAYKRMPIGDPNSRVDISIRLVRSTRSSEPARSQQRVHHRRSVQSTRRASCPAAVQR